MKTTKGGKVMNPTDAYRKELRKKELKRVRFSTATFAYMLCWWNYDVMMLCDYCMPFILETFLELFCILQVLVTMHLSCLGFQCIHAGSTFCGLHCKFPLCGVFQNKKERKKVREVGILKKDPDAIKEQIKKLEIMSVWSFFPMPQL